MKIAIPVDSDQTNVCVSFGRAPFFAVKNTETGETVCHINPAAEAEGGAGIKAAQAVIDSGADVIITVRMGKNSAEILKTENIRILKSAYSSAQENFKAFENGMLLPLTEFSSGYHGLR